MKLKKHKIYLVEWIDSESNDDWRDFSYFEKYIKDVARIRTVGYFLVEDDNYIIVVQNWDDINYSNSMKIPKTQIINVKKL